MAEKLFPACDEELQEVKNILHFPEWQQEREWFF